ncbi:flavodoxin [uncultured Senegalimassilia sp.]|uniref:flavodoxin n=1 Tax=uncultured Senegalimassilia sp. TaxID=1714350 RepID=UPI002673775D|nr:flavodoxin [uncultured Senegalimassilia sp.]
MFSWSGHTLTAAQHLNDIVDADFFRIEPAEPYATNYSEVVDVAQAEQNANARPALAQTVEDWNSYSTIYLGFPVWWYDAPQIIKTFMDSHDCTSKTVAVFSTSGGSSVESCLSSLRAIAPGATFTRSVTLDGDAASSQLSQLGTWQAELGL